MVKADVDNAKIIRIALTTPHVTEGDKSGSAVVKQAGREHRSWLEVTGRLKKDSAGLS